MRKINRIERIARREEKNTINNKKFDFNYRTNFEVLTSPQQTLIMLQSVLKSIYEKTLCIIILNN